MRIKKLSAAFVFSVVCHIGIIFVVGLLLMDPSYRSAHMDDFGFSTGEEVILFRVQEPPKPRVRQPIFNSKYERYNAQDRHLSTPHKVQKLAITDANSTTEVLNNIPSVDLSNTRVSALKDPTIPDASNSRVHTSENRTDVERIIPKPSYTLASTQNEGSPKLASAQNLGAARDQLGMVTVTEKVHGYVEPPPLSENEPRRRFIRKGKNVPQSQTLRHQALNPPNGAAYHDVFFDDAGTNPFIDTEDDNFSTFGMDVDTASYTVMRRYLRDGYLPPSEAIRVEEFVNALDYNYAPPTDEAFAIHLEGAPSKFGEGKRLRLLRIGIQGRVIPDTDRKDAILTFVVDVSGSMRRENRLELVKRALTLLLEQLRPSDKVGIVVYGSDARVVLPHTSIVNREHILTAIRALAPEGATNAEAGLRIGYKLATQNANPDAINRVILCSDGVANVGQTGPEAILKEIRTYVKEGVTLTTVGFGMGNYNDVLMEQLANNGNGSYTYVDTLSEAKRNGSLWKT